MRTIEIRRHSYTKKGDGRGKGSHLSPEGVALARRVGGGIWPCYRGPTSPVPRALETALGMGLGVDGWLRALGYNPASGSGEIGHHERWAWEAPFVRFANFVRQGGPTARMGERQREAWVRAMGSI